MIRFIIFTDPHYGAYDDFGMTSNERMEWIVELEEKVVNTKKGLDFTVHCGDLKNHDYDPEGKHGLEDVENHLKNLINPYYPIHGGHDKATKEEWQSIFDINKNYTFEYGDYGFIVLDTWNNSDVETSYWQESEADLIFLEDELNNFLDKNAVFIFNHYMTEDINNQTIQKISEYENVKGVFEGHNHRYQTTIQENIEYYRCGRWSLPYNRYEADPRDMKTDIFSYRVVEINEFNNRLYTYQFLPEYVYPDGNYEDEILQSITIKKGIPSFISTDISRSAWLWVN